jgi:hypothetical protein
MHLEQHRKLCGKQHLQSLLDGVQRVNSQLPGDACNDNAN